MIYFAKIPKEMKNSISWLAWHKLFDSKTGKYKKRPNQFRKETPDQHIGWDMLKLQTFQEAKDEYMNHASKSDGIGFAFTSTSVWAGIDIDDALFKDGRYNTPVREIIKPILAQAIKDKCYIEKSISGTGYHIFGWTSIKPTLQAVASAYIKGNNIEIHFEKSYFTVSGDRLNDGWGCLDDSIRIAYQIIKGQPLSEQLPEPEQKSTKTPIIKDITANNNQVGDNVPLTDKPTKKQAETLPEGEFSDTDVLQLPGMSVSATLSIMAKDRRKYGAETDEALRTGYPNEDLNKSDFDAKIIGTLCYWLYRYGEAEICKVFEKSALYRSPDTTSKGKNYVQYTVHKEYLNAEKFFPAVNYKRLTAEEKDKLKRWVRRKEKE